MEFFAPALVITLVAVCTVALVRRNLRQRPHARRLREAFIGLADQLVGNPEFPEAHARQLVTMAGIPGGWATRFMVFMLLKQIFTGRPPLGKNTAPRIDQVPEHLRAKYALAILSLALGDSYRCAILGRIWRGSNSWVVDAIREVDPDINAHATRSVVIQMSNVHSPRRQPLTGYATA